jgi:5-methyltetrahydropteroyltriglutamate--homocysteine methyltransferase
MISSRDRILTTHVGSLPRNAALSELLVRREVGASYDQAQLDAEMDKAVRHVVAKQKEAGIDIGNDGEQQRVGFQTYVPQRMSGFGGESKRRRAREFEEFPELAQYVAHRFPNVSRQQNAPQAQAELHYHDTLAIEREIARFQRVAGEDKPFGEALMTAPSPGIIASTMLNAYYATHEAYLAAIAREMRNEYLAIHRAGLALQIDVPDLATDRTMFYRDQSDAEFVRAVELHVAMINSAIAGIRASACGSTSATAIGKARTSTTSRSKKSCPPSTRPRPARCRSSSPIRAMPTNTRRSSACRCPRT